MAELAPHDLTSVYSHATYYVTASSFFATLPPWKAFDNSTNYWIGTGGGVDWLQLDLGIGASATLSSYTIQVNVVPEPNRAPKNFTMKGSNDGTTWTTVDTQTNQTSWTSGEIRTFTLGATSAAYRYFRLDITANNGDATYTQVAELHLIGTQITAQASDFAPHDLTSNSSHSPIVTSATSFFSTLDAYHAFDGNLDGSHRWLGQGSGVDSLTINFGSGNTFTLLGYWIALNTSISEPNRAPKNWTIEGSNNGSSWTTIDTVTNETAWTSAESDVRSYTCDDITTAYQYFRLNITANNGDATYTQVAEMYLYGNTGGAGGTGTAQPQMFIVC
jgi:hypothetical protein